MVRVLHARSTYPSNLTALGAVEASSSGSELVGRDWEDIYINIYVGRTKYRRNLHYRRVSNARCECECGMVCVCGMWFMISHYQLNTRPDKGLYCAPNKRGDGTPYITKFTLRNAKNRALYRLTNAECKQRKVNIQNILEHPTQSSFTTINLRNCVELVSTIPH